MDGGGGVGRAQRVLRLVVGVRHVDEQVERPRV